MTTLKIAGDSPVTAEMLSVLFLRLLGKDVPEHRIPHLLDHTLCEHNTALKRWYGLCVVTTPDPYVCWLYSLDTGAVLSLNLLNLERGVKILRVSDAGLSPCCSFAA